jgi:alpha-ketoglutarate-dependent taurine dioxygenase
MTEQELKKEILKDHEESETIDMACITRLHTLFRAHGEPGKIASRLLDTAMHVIDLNQKETT